MDAYTEDGHSGYCPIESARSLEQKRAIEDIEAVSDAATILSAIASVYYDSPEYRLRF